MSREAAERLFDVIDVRTALEPRDRVAIKNSIIALRRSERRATVERIRAALPVEAAASGLVERARLLVILDTEAAK